MLPKHILAFAAVVFSTLGGDCLAAGPASNPTTEAVQSITAAELQDHVNTLADDVFEGRAVGTRGGRAAAQYIVKQIQQSRLQPAGTDDYYYPCDRGGRSILVLLPGSDPVLKNE